MKIIKGYTVTAKKTLKRIEMVMFSGFSNILIKEDNAFTEYRNEIQKEKAKQYEQDVTIGFIIFDIPEGTVDQIIVDNYMKRMPIDEIAERSSVSIEQVRAILDTYMHETKI